VKLHSLPRRAAAIALSATLLLAAGCAGSSKTGTPDDPGASLRVSHQLNADLPDDIRSRGELRVVTDASYAPASSFAADGRTIIGFEPDLGAALGRVLGIRVVFRNADFATLPALVNSGRADLIISAMTDTAEREKDLDFVNYFAAGTSVVVSRGNPHGISDLESLCGQRVAVQAGTVQQDLLKREQSRCGAKLIKVTATDTNDDALMLLRTGRAAAMLMDYPPAEALTTDPSTRAHYQLATTTQYEPGLYGIGIAKGNTALRETVSAALSVLISSGTYAAVLREWNVSEGAVAEVSTNAATGG
jgi:polar amino acid transport system substrate-binding protein